MAPCGSMGFVAEIEGVFRGRASHNTLQMLKGLNTKRGDIVWLLRGDFNLFISGF